MNKLYKFFQDGLNDQVKTAGDEVIIYNPKTKSSVNFQGVLTENSGDVSVQIGSILYQVNAHILIPDTININVGDIIKYNNFEYKIISFVKSPFETAYSCQLIKI